MKRFVLVLVAALSLAMAGGCAGDSGKEPKPTKKLTKGKKAPSKKPRKKAHAKHPHDHGAHPHGAYKHHHHSHPHPHLEGGDHHHPF